MAGLRTAAMLEAIETLDDRGMAGQVLVQELTADLGNETAYNFVSKLNKRMNIVLKHSYDVEKESDDDEAKHQKPEREKPEEAKKPATEERPASKSVEDLLNEIV